MIVGIFLKQRLDCRKVSRSLASFCFVVACLFTEAEVSAQIVELPSGTIRFSDLDTRSTGRTERSNSYPVQPAQEIGEVLGPAPVQNPVQNPVPDAAVNQLPQQLPGQTGLPVDSGTPNSQSAQASPFSPVPLQDAPLAPAPVAPGVQGLNVDPAAPIDALTPPPATAINPANISLPGRAAAGAAVGSFSAAPTIMGDFFGIGLSQFSGGQTQTFSEHASGTILSGVRGDPNAIIAFEFGLDTAPNDIFTDGQNGDAFDVSGDSIVDTFAIAEPLPGSDALTSPGQGFLFDGGTATYTAVASSDTAANGAFANNEQWLIQYSYTQQLGGGTTAGTTVRPLPGPGVAARRVKLAENFSPEVRDRWFFNYNFFNDAFGGLGDVSRFTFGTERMLVEDLISIEARIPTAATYASTQELNDPEDRDFELGNITLIGKAILLRTRRFLWSSGVGVAFPTASDSRLRRGGQDLLVVENEAVHLLPFTGLLWRKDRNTSIQGYLQADVAANGDPVFGNLAGGPLPKLGVFNDSTLLHTDVAVNRVVYRNQYAGLRQLILNAELHYTATLQDSDVVSNGSLTYTNLKNRFNIVNGTVGAHLVLANNLVVSPAFSVPLRDGLDEQFDYEAIVQLNYLR